MAERVYLWVSAHDRAYVRALGAQWDSKCRQWYVPADLDVAPFAPWIDYFLYIVMGKHLCVDCRCYTRVVSFGLPLTHQGIEYLVLVPRLECVPFEIRAYLASCGVCYQPAGGDKNCHRQLVNCCEYCRCPQPDVLLFSPPDGVFSCTSLGQIEELTFYRVRLAYPCMMNDMFAEYRRRTRFGYGLVESCEYWHDFAHDMNRILFHYALACHTRLAIVVSELVRPCMAP